MCTLYRCASQDDSDVGELAKEVQLLRDEVNQLKCHYDAISPVFHDDAARAWEKNGTKISLGPINGYAKWIILIPCARFNV